MYIGQAAQRSGTTIKSIRHYESIGLLPTPRRQGNYRLYDQECRTADLHQVRQKWVFGSRSCRRSSPDITVRRCRGRWHTAIYEKKRDQSHHDRARGQYANSKGSSRAGASQIECPLETSNDLRVSEQLDVEHRQLPRPGAIGCDFSSQPQPGVLMPRTAPITVLRDTLRCRYSTPANGKTRRRPAHRQPQRLHQRRRRQDHGHMDLHAGQVARRLCEVEYCHFQKATA